MLRRFCFTLLPQIVENSVCTLRNLSYRLEVEMPSSRLLGNQELDALLGFSSPAKELDYLCWGKRRRGRKRGGWPDDKVQGGANNMKMDSNGIMQQIVVAVAEHCLLVVCYTVRYTQGIEA